MLERRLHAAFDHVACDVLGEPRPGAWSSTPSAHAAQALFREAAVAGDIARIRSLYDDIRDVLTKAGALERAQVIVWGDDALAGAEYDLLQSAFQDDIGLTAQLVAPDPARAAALRSAIPALLHRLGAVLPLWQQEFTALVAQIHLAETSQGGFGGASAFAAWGAILVNPRAQADDLALLLTLIHESSHLKLFSAYVDDEIVLNDPDEGYSSPLRHEPRPMNGIYHAAFVLARMICFLDDLRGSGRVAEVLGPLPEGAIEAALESSVERFRAAHEVIRDHGRLTALGRTIIEEAAAGVAAADHARASA